MKANLLLTILSLTFINCTFGQKDVVGAGGQATGSGGSVSYSIGQIDYITSAGSGGTITQGVQQPYEIFVVSGIKEQTINLLINAFPNPVIEFVTLDLSETGNETKYILYNVEGKKIKENDISEKTTSIQMSELSSGIYFLEVQRNNQKIKQYKIVKN